MGNEIGHFDLRAPERLAALRDAQLLDTPGEEGFDRFTRLAVALTKAPVALVSLVDDRRQFFKSTLGLAEPWSTRRETGLSHSFCKFVVARGSPLIISDARQDPLVRENLAIPDLGVVAYLGAPLILSSGHVLGSFCVIDGQPREWTQVEVSAVKDLAFLVVSEIEHRQAKAEFSTLADNITQLAWMARPDGSVYWYNRRWYEYTGSRPEDAEGLGWKQFHHPDHVERVAQQFSAALQAGQYWEDTFPLRAHDGSYRWFLSRAVPVRDQAGDVVRWLGTNTDVTEQREAQTRAAEAERRLQVALQSGRIGTWSWDFKSDLLEPDHKVKEIFGFEGDAQVRTEEFFQRIHPEDIPGLNESIERARGELGNYDFEFRIVLPSGEQRWAVARGNVAKHPSGVGLYMIGVTWDISERRQTEEALRETSERYRLASRATNDAIWDWNLETDRIHWNEAVCTLFGYCEDTVDTPASWWVEHIHPEDRDRVINGIHEVIEGGGSHWTDEYRFLEADGAYAQVLDRGYMLRDRSGRPLRMIGAMQDITDRKSFEEELAAAKDAAEAANQAKSQFIANMSHELRTPLTAVIGYCDMLEEEAHDLGVENLVPDLEKINANAHHLLNLINDVLDISKIEAGKMEVHAEDFDPGALAADVAETIKALAEKKQNRVLVNCAFDLGTMHSDVVKIRQCLLNLLSNASKFSQNGTIELNLSKEHSGTEDWIIFQVRDSGIGMTEEQVSRLFQRFTQADASTTRRFGGTGLGLAITKAFSTMLGGGISVQSIVGVGTTFTIRLPADLKPALAKVSADVAIAEANGSEEPVNSADLVLVVDDDPSARDLLRRFLKRENFAVLTANDGQTGLQLARARRPCAILLDVMMPQMDGWAVLTALKADPDLCDIPVIMVTMVQEKHLGFSLGAADYLIKPVQWTRLKNVLEKYRSSDAPGAALLMDPNPESRAELRQLIEAQGWSVLEAEDRRGAKGRIAEHCPGLILVDLQEASMDGLGLLQELSQDPQLRSIPIIALASRELSQEDADRLQGHVRQIIQEDEQRREEELIDELRRIARARSSSSRAA